MGPALTRRAFLGAMAGTGAVAVPLASRAAGASTSVKWVYWLDPDWGAGHLSCVPNQGQATCGGCYACVSHYHNKLFASAAAADAGRAHPGCKCLVGAAFTVDASTYDTLFADGNTSVDRRTAGVNEILAGSTSAPAGSTGASTDTTTSGGASTTDTVLAFTGSSIGPLAIAGAGAVAAGVVMRRVAKRPSADEVS